MLEKLNKFSYKSFKDYTNPNDLHFLEKNIIFGYNGKGKSALCIGLKQEYLKVNPKGDNNYRLFCKEYIKKSLLLENSDEKIRGVKANFGEKDVEVITKINKLIEEIIPETDIDNYQTEIDKIRKETRKEIDSIHERKKGKANIQKKSNSETVEKIIELYKKDYSEANKIERNDDILINTIGDDTIEKQIKQFESLNQLSVSEISDSDVDEINNIFKEKYDNDIEIPGHEIVQWIDDGLKIHQEDDKCKFCGGKLDYSEVKVKLEQYKENKRHKAIKRLKSFNEQMQLLLNEIETIENHSKTYIAIIGNNIEKDFKSIIDCKNDIDTLITSIQKKIDKIDNNIDFNFEKIKSIAETINTAIINVRTEKEKQLAELRKKQSNLETLVKGSIGLEIIKSPSIESKIKEINTKEIELKTKQDNNKSKQQEIKNLEQQESPTNDFAIFVSQILNDINISLNVEVDTDNHNYIIKSSHEDVTLTINDISEGEKNLLALLFFYYELFNDNEQKEIKTEIELIIIDDPISSMDDSNKFYILELMKNLLDLQKQQVFVLTHSWDDFCNLSYGKKAWGKNSKYANFEITKNAGQSELIKIINIEKPYKHLFKEIYIYSQKKQKELFETDCEIYHYPNIIRRVFEEWYNFKIGKVLNLTSNQQERLAADLKLTKDNDKTKLGILLKVCNILSHSINNSKNPQEIHQSANFLMKLIKDNDPLHFSNMKE
jgi:wobble nucleotide-excising tRNase